MEYIAAAANHGGGRRLQRGAAGAATARRGTDGRPRRPISCDPPGRNGGEQPVKTGVTDCDQRACRTCGGTQGTLWPTGQTDLYSGRTRMPGG